MIYFRFIVEYLNNYRIKHLSIAIKIDGKIKSNGPSRTETLGTLNGPDGYKVDGHRRRFILFGRDRLLSKKGISLVYAVCTLRLLRTKTAKELS